MVSEQVVDQAWAQLADKEGASREGEMAARYTELAALSEDERRTRLRAMARAEYSLSDDKLRSFTLSRMRTWIGLEHDKAATVAGSYDAIMRELPGAMAMRRVSLVQTLSKEFSVEDEETLRGLVPGVFAGAPSRSTGLSGTEPTLPARAAEKKKKPFWAFWSRG